jgi:hypothetical protein
VDLHLTTADTVKAVMLRDSTAAAVTALRSALADPGRCEIDALVATRIAGMATIDTDATAYASVPVLHALSSSCAGALRQQWHPRPMLRRVTTMESTRTMS